MKYAIQILLLLVVAALAYVGVKAASGFDWSGWLSGLSGGADSKSSKSRQSKSDKSEKSKRQKEAADATDGKGGAGRDGSSGSTDRTGASDPAYSSRTTRGNERRKQTDDCSIGSRVAYFLFGPSTNRGKCE